MKLMKYKKFTDNFNAVLGKLKNTVRSASIKYGTVYVGATSDLKTRFSKYKNWKYGQIIYETEFHSLAKAMEDGLIQYIKDNPDITECNKDPHSKGLRTGKDMYYVYVIADNVCKVR